MIGLASEVLFDATGGTLLPISRFICGGKSNEPRQVAVYLIRKLCDTSLKEIAKLFSLGSYGSVGGACSVVDRQLKEDMKLRRRIEEVRQRVRSSSVGKGLDGLTCLLSGSEDLVPDELRITEYVDTLNRECCGTVPNCARKALEHGPRVS